MHFVALADAWASWLESFVDFFSFGTIQLQPLYRTIFKKKKEDHLLVERPVSRACGTLAMAQPTDTSGAAAPEVKLQAGLGSDWRQLNIQGGFADLSAELLPLQASLRRETLDPAGRQFLEENHQKTLRISEYISEIKKACFQQETRGKKACF